MKPIDQRELRLGNYILDDEGRVGVVERIESDYFNEWDGSGDEVVIYSIDGSIRQSENIYPIKLTEKLFLKCFNVKVDGFSMIIFAGALPITFRFNSGRVYCEVGDVYLGDRITYLHELQNLVQILLGRELIFKNKP